MKPNERTIRFKNSTPAGFTLIELTVVIAATAILVALLLPGLARGNQQADGVQCLASLQQLSQAWLMYNSDNQGKFVPNGSEGTQGASSPTSPDLSPGGADAQWCPGRQDPGLPGGQWLSPANLPANKPNIGLEWIQAGLIYPYVKNVQDYLCPADDSYNLVGGVPYPHVRSRSMNVWLQPLPLGTFTSPIDAGPQDASLRVYRKESDLSVPGPANTFLFIDVSPQSINASWFIADPTDPTVGRPTWVDAPAIFHNGACGISFCDGHVGLKKWRDPILLDVTQMEVTGNWETTTSKYEPDVLWLVHRATALQTATAFLGPQGW